MVSTINGRSLNSEEDSGLCAIECQRGRQVWNGIYINSEHVDGVFVMELNTGTLVGHPEQSRTVQRVMDCAYLRLKLAA